MEPHKESGGVSRHVCGRWNHTKLVYPASSPVRNSRANSAFFAEKLSRGNRKFAGVSESFQVFGGVLWEGKIRALWAFWEGVWWRFGRAKGSANFNGKCQIRGARIAHRAILNQPKWHAERSITAENGRKLVENALEKFTCGHLWSLEVTTWLALA